LKGSEIWIKRVHVFPTQSKAGAMINFLEPFEGSFKKKGVVIGAPRCTDIGKTAAGVSNASLMMVKILQDLKGWSLEKQVNQ
jgi:hypothetical protein